MRKWFMGMIRSAAADTSTANDFVESSRKKIQGAGNGDEIAFAAGLDFMVKKLMNHLRADRERVLSATGFDNSTLDKVYRWTLGAAEKAQPMLFSATFTDCGSWRRKCREQSCRPSKPR